MVDKITETRMPNAADEATAHQALRRAFITVLARVIARDLGLLQPPMKKA